jgi:spermidine synthase
MKTKKTLIKKFLNQKFYLFAFLTGFSMMVIELTASRILAPLVGSSVYTWTSVIGVMLSGLVLGNFLGGHMIDRKPKVETITTFYYASAISVLAIPSISQKISQIILLDSNLFILTLLATSLLFFIPSVCIGLIYPCLFKLELVNFSTIGISSGKMSGAWSLGSIIGTFLTGFYFIQNIGSTQTLYLISFMLLLSGFLMNPRKIKVFIFLFTLNLTIIFIQQKQDISKNLLYDHESSYYRIRVTENPDLQNNKLRYLFLDLDSHSVESFDNKKLDLYTNIPPVFAAFKENINSILVIGGGSQAISRNFSTSYPNSTIKTVELDREVALVAKKYFPVISSKIETEISDGRFFLNKNKNTYDIIFSDAYNSFISVPYHMTTIEFDLLAKKRLNDRGIYAVNFISSLEGTNSAFFQSMLQTITKVFPENYVFSYGKDPHSIQNIIILGVNSNNKKQLNSATLLNALKKIDDSGYYSEKFIKDPSIFLNNKNNMILSDNFSPTEKLMSPIIKAYFPKYKEFFFKNI